VVLGVMQEGPSGGPPSEADLNSWNDTYALEHPQLNDGGMSQSPYVTLGYPTYVVIDREMVIQNADLWPFDANYVIGLL